MGFGFDFGFGMFGVMFTLMFILVFGIIIVTIVRGIGQWNKNNNSPRLTVAATVVSKRTNVSHHHHDHHTHHSTSYYVTFQVDSGDRMELHMTGQEYGMLVEGDKGNLTFQGHGILDLREYKNSAVPFAGAALFCYLSSICSIFRVRLFNKRLDGFLIFIINMCYF